MATLSIINSVSLTYLGTTVDLFQGDDTDAITDSYDDLSIDGTHVQAKGTIATGAGATIFSSSSLPATFDYCWIKATKACYIQLVTAATNVKLQMAAYVPFVVPGIGKLLAAADTTAMSSEPTLANITTVKLWNESSSTLSWQAIFVT